MDRYDALLVAIQEAMREAHRLGCVRTSEKLHKALDEGRAERWEAQPILPGSVTFRIGPISEQPTTRK